MNVALRSNAATAFAAPTNNTSFELISNGARKVEGYSLLIAVTNSAPAAGAFTAAASDICTKSAHGFLTGLKVQVSTSTTLPAGLSAVTDYFVIKLSANTFSLATTLALAQAGTAIDITDAGTGTHTITPTAIAGASLKLQGSQDGSVWADIPVKASGDATKIGTITATANYLLSDSEPQYDHVRVAYTLTAGQISVVETLLTKGY